MTVAMPDTNMFQGDLLSQVHADIPSVAFTSGPADGATISGSVTLSGSAYLPNLNNQSTATGIAKLRLFVDGLDTGAFVSAASGSFILDTTTLTDGIHEVRFVAFNNSAAASQGRASKNFQVNNLGQSVSVTGSSSYNVGASQTISIPVSASQGSGPVITGIQLQSLGRVVGSISGVSGNVSLSGTSLAYGSNTLTPVAILSGGGQVQGPSVTVTRRFQPIAGSASTPLAQRNPGFDFYYFPGAAQKTIAATNFSGTPAYVRHSNTLQINPVSSTPGLMNMPDAYRVAAGGTNVGLAVMIKGAFTVTTAGEYAFGFTASALSSTGGVKGGGILWSSYSLEIDGITVSTYDCWSGSTFNAIANQADTLRSAYLLPGEHTITVKLANVPSNGTNTADASLGFLCQFRGLDANMRGSPAMFQTFNTNGYAAAPYFYTVNKNAGH